MKPAALGMKSKSIFFVTDDDPLIALAREVAELLTGAPVQIEQVPTGGRNSRIYRVRSRGESFALKQYPPLHADPRNRLSTEATALVLMRDHGITAVPSVIALDRNSELCPTELGRWHSGTRYQGRRYRRGARISLGSALNPPRRSCR